VSLLEVVTAMPLIFAYGTLQEPNVQRTLFGRLLRGASDELKGAEVTVATGTTPAGLTFNVPRDSQVRAWCFRSPNPNLRPPTATSGPATTGA
jgi:hypothetical protein